MAWALIVNGTVAQINQTNPAGLYPPDMIWAECAATVQESWLATETNGGWTFSAPPAPTPTLAQQAATQLASGVAVTFTTGTTLSATYSTTLAAQVKIMAEANWLIKNGTFINGTATLVLVDMAGTQRSFNPTQFAAFEAAYAPYISAVDLVADSNQGTLPAAALTVNA